MDVVQKVKDLTKLALDEGTTANERLQAALGALRLIERYELLGKKRIDVAASIIDTITSPTFVEGVATRAEKIADGVERVIGSFKKVADHIPRGDGGGRRGGGSGRRYGGSDR